jgi:replication-associated recombination protein RarA
MTLPKTKSVPSNQNPRRMILFGKPKTGKTTALAGLDNLLILDTEDGVKYLSCFAVSAKTVEEFGLIAKAITEEKEKTGQ